jgi:hypothetical protein
VREGLSRSHIERCGSQLDARELMLLGVWAERQKKACVCEKDCRDVLKRYHPVSWATILDLRSLRRRQLHPRSMGGPRRGIHRENATLSEDE